MPAAHLVFAEPAATHHVTLTWPPSVNHYYNNLGYGRVVISVRGQVYRSLTDLRVKDARRQGSLPRQRIEGRLRVVVMCCPPDVRTRDLDNLGKALFDSLTKAGAWRDDSQIDELTYRRGLPTKGGACTVIITEMPPAMAAEVA